MRRFVYFVREVIAKRRSSGPVTGDAVGTFEIAGTYTLDDYAVETSGSFNITGTYTVA